MAGTRLFLSGEIAYATDVNNFLMDQVIARFTNEAQRDLAFGDGVAISLGGDGKPLLTTGQFCYLIDRGDGFGEVQYWDGDSWVSSSQFTIADGVIIESKIATGAVTSTKIAPNSIDSSHIAPGTVIESDINDLSVTTGKINDLAVTTGKIADLNVTTGKIADTAVTAAKIATAVAGSGLSGGAGTALAVNVDDSTIEINADTLRIKDIGITSGKLASNLTLAGTVTGNPTAGTVSTGTSGFGYMGLPQNATTTGAYTVLATDAGKHIYSTATRTITIPANTATAMPVGSTLVFIAGSGATVTIAITTDTMYLAGPGTTGSRTLAAFGMSTAVKITATSWIISGNGLT
jgi:hypothetical protein